MNMKKRSISQSLIATAAALALTLTVTPAPADPPPHAPAHGYRHQQFHGYDLVYDQGIGVYVVADLDHQYFLDGLFFKWSDGNWFVRVSPDDEWKPRPPGTIPPGLAKKYRNLQAPAKPKRRP